MRGNADHRRRDKRFWLCLEAVCLAAFLVLTIILLIRFTRQAQRSAEEQDAQESMITIQEERSTEPLAVFYANVNSESADYFDFAVTEFPDESAFENIPV